MENKPKIGDVRDDGKVLHAIKNTKKGREYHWWVTPTRRAQMLEKTRVAGTLWRNKNPNKVKEAEERRRSRPDHKEKVAVWNKRYYKANREARLKYAAEYGKANPEVGKRARQKFRANNTNKCRWYTNEWAKRNTGRMQEKSVRRRRLLAAQPSLTKPQATTVVAIYEARARVSKCTGVIFHVDHIHPLCYGGLHAPENLQILPWKLNLSKGRKILSGLPLAAEGCITDRYTK